jgi:hypothetical protein
VSRVVFEASGVSYRWSDVLGAARAWGDWERLERRAKQRFDRLRTAEADGDGPSPSEVKAHADEFRFARNLLAAEEMEAWLTHWGLTVRRWMDQIRATAIARLPASVDSVDPVDFDVVWADAVCSGELDRLAQRLAERLAVSAAAGEEPPSAPLDALAVGAMERTFGQFCETVAHQGSIDREVAVHFLGWTRIDWRYVACPLEEAAREAALCAREDGLPLEAVARSAGLALHESSQLLDDADPQIALPLTGAQPGAILGPLRVDDEFWVIEAGERFTPSPQDPAVRERAQRLVAARAVAREVSGRVMWRERNS